MFTKAGAEAYFNAEKSQSLLFLIIGLVAIATAVVLLLLYKSNLYKGLAIPLVLIGFIQSVAGYTVHSRSDKQRMDIVYKMDMNPAAIGNDEIPGMKKVMKFFTVYRYSEIVLLVTGIVLFVYCRKNEQQQFWMGLGMALALQAGIILLADGFAESRGRKYLEGLNNFSQSKK